MPERGSILVVVPVAGMADHGAGLPLDIEERVLMRVVRAASRQRAESVRLLVVPPLRFVTGPATPDGGAAFAVDAPEAHAFVDEVCASLAASGFRRIVLCNASPWNEEVCDAAARDIRIARGLQMFCVNLSALGLGFSGGDATKWTRIAAHSASDGDEPAVTAAGARLAGLLEEIAGRPPLVNDGRISTKT